MTPLISRVIADENFPSHPRVQIGTVDNKPVYLFHIAPELFYERDNKVYAPFISSNGSPMQYVFRYGKYNLDKVLSKMGKPSSGDFEHLIVETEFI